MLSFDVPDIWCWFLCWGGRERKLLMWCCTHHWSQHGRNMREEGGGLLMFDCCTQPSRNIARNGSQHARNICYLALNRMAEIWFDSHQRVADVSDASARIGRPGANSSKPFIMWHTQACHLLQLTPTRPGFPTSWPKPPPVFRRSGLTGYRKTGQIWISNKNASSNDS
jgi:hypothetical protein